MTEWEMYLLVKLDDLQSLLYATTLVSALTTMLSGCIYLTITSSYMGDEEENLALKIRQYLRRAGMVLITSGVLYTATPSTKQAATVYLIPKLLQNESVQRMPELFNELSKAWIETLKPKSSGEK